MLKRFTNTSIGFAIAIIVVVVAGAGLAFEPVTRNVVAVKDLCLYCHVEQEYVATFRLSPSSLHPPKGAKQPPAVASDGKAAASAPVETKRAQCVECHLPTGFVNSVYAYLHFASITDLYGHLRDRKKERSGPWLPARQVAAYRVRDRLYEYDSSTCRSCHIEAEIKPKRERGKNAHELALKDKKTCIECHTNENHRFVDVRPDAFDAGEG